MGDAKRTLFGGCHCGLVRYSIHLDPTTLKGIKCNCSYCHKYNVFNIKVSYTILSPSDPGSDPNLGDYSAGKKTLHIRFCKTCGVYCFWSRKTYEHFESPGVLVEDCGINAVTLDQGQGVDLRAVEVEYWDGKNDNWEAGPSDKPYPGGVHWLL